MRLSTSFYYSFNVINLGRMSYQKALAQQQKYVDIAKQHKSSDKPKNFLLSVEHDPVYTVGIRSKLYSEEEEKRLQKLGAEFYRTSRGGLITFHGPGQLVLYPIFDLKRIASQPIGVRKFVETLEQIIIDVGSESYSIPKVGRTHHTGVWVGENHKLAALGIAVSHGVSYHGLALNCNTDLQWFKHVIGCGIEGTEATSLSRECGRNISIDDALPHMIESFTKQFECEAL